MGDVLEGALQELILRIPNDRAQLLVYAKPAAVKRHVRHADRCLLEGRAKLDFTVAHSREEVVHALLRGLPNAGAFLRRRWCAHDRSRAVDDVADRARYE